MSGRPHDFFNLMLDEHARKLASIITESTHNPNSLVVATVKNFWGGRTVEGVIQDPEPDGIERTEFVADETTLVRSIQTRLVNGRSLSTRTDDGRTVLWTVH